MDFSKSINEVKQSLEEFEILFSKQLILNPVENIPYKKNLYPSSTALHGIYNSDKLRDNNQKINTKIQFSSRDNIAEDINKIYRMWLELLGGEGISLRMFSGLHAHMVIFMAISNIGDTIMLLPEEAGGHMATKSILNRLGLKVCEFAIDYSNKKVDKEKSLKIEKKHNPSIVFIDRSEGLIYEDFSWISEMTSSYKIFDASQYLTNIIAKDYTNPFEMGFDAIISTLHKNLPGPQRALFCVKSKDKVWDLFNNKIGTYVSNMHSYSIYSAGLVLEELPTLKMLSKEMLLNTDNLDQVLDIKGIPITNRLINKKEPITHHIWIKANTKEEAFKFYLNLEMMGILVNYRLLPYNIGYGIRIGLSGATFSGLRSDHMEYLGYLIKKAYLNNVTPKLINESNEFISKLKKENKYKLDEKK